MGEREPRQTDSESERGREDEKGLDGTGRVLTKNRLEEWDRGVLSRQVELDFAHSLRISTLVQEYLYHSACQLRAASMSAVFPLGSRFSVHALYARRRSTTLLQPVPFASIRAEHPVCPPPPRPRDTQIGVAPRFSSISAVSASPCLVGPCRALKYVSATVSLPCTATEPEVCA